MQADRAGQGRPCGLAGVEEMIFWTLLPGLWRALWLVPIASALAGAERRLEVMSYTAGWNLLGTEPNDKTPAGVGMSAGVRRPYLRVVGGKEE